MQTFYQISLQLETDPEGAFISLLDVLEIDDGSGAYILTNCRGDFRIAAEYLLEKHGELWLNALGERAVTLASEKWEISKAEAWGKLSRAIKNEDVSDYLPLTEFTEYIKFTAQSKTSFDFKNLFEYHIKRLGLLPKDAEKILATYNGNYQKAAQRLSNLYYPIRSQTETPSIQQQAIPPLIENHHHREDSFFEKILTSISSVIAIIVIVAIIALYIFTTSYYSGESSPAYSGPCSEVAPEDRKECLDVYYYEKQYDPAMRYDLESEPLDDPYSNFEPDSPFSDSTACVIKGNISFETGEKIYHMPGQKYYEVTTVDTTSGERWFCTEAEAQASGWRKSKE